MPELTDTY